MKAGHEQAYKTAIGVKKLCGAGRGEGNVWHQTVLTRSISHSFHFNKPLCHGRKTFPHEIHTGCSQHAPNTDLASRKPLYSLQDFDKAFYLRNFTRADVPKEKKKKKTMLLLLSVVTKQKFRRAAPLWQTAAAERLGWRSLQGTASGDAPGAGREPVKRGRGAPSSPCAFGDPSPVPKRGASAPAWQRALAGARQRRAQPPRPRQG